MGLLRVVGDMKMEDVYMKALMDLQKSHIWSKFLNFHNYYMQPVGTKEEG